MDFHSRSMPSIVQEPKHLKREPLSLVVTSYPSVAPNTSSGNMTTHYTHHHSVVSNPDALHQTMTNCPKLESDDPLRSHYDFYLSEDEVTYLNELFKTDLVEPTESTASNAGNEGAEETKMHHKQQMDIKEARKTQSGTRKQKALRTDRFTKSSALELEEIQKYFDMPINVAAKEMNIGLTVLKKRCRELNIMRWPHRKIKSLKSLISNVKELGLEKEIQMLEEHRMIVEKMPEVELTEKTKKLRQACFKANYKKRRQSQSSACLSLVKFVESTQL